MRNRDDGRKKDDVCKYLLHRVALESERMYVENESRVVFEVESDDDDTSEEVDWKKDKVTEQDRRVVEEELPPELKYKGENECSNLRDLPVDESEVLPARKQHVDEPEVLTALKQHVDEKRVSDYLL